jgi:hypothetical protein
LFRDDQFVRAISQGAISVLKDDLRKSLIKAYAAIGEAKQLTSGSIVSGWKDDMNTGLPTQVANCAKGLPGILNQSLSHLLSFLGCAGQD